MSGPTGGSGQSLAGHRVVVTRSSDQAGSLADLLEARGAEPVVVPLVQVESIDDGVEQLRSLDLADFDWLLITSPNGAESYAVARGSVTPRRVAAVGTTTATALRDHGIEVHLVPSQQRADALAAAVPDPVGRALVVQAADAAPTLVDDLRARGAEVTAVVTYRTVPRHPSAREQLAALSADAVLFASGSAVRSWVAVFGDATPPVVVAMGPQTAAAAAAAGVAVSAVAEVSSLEGLVDALEGQLGRR
jgi:uroporphyrinogen-III synthase